MLFLFFLAASGAPGAPVHELSANIYVEPPTRLDDKTCHALTENPDGLNMSQFCTESDGCWPGLWLLGAQKAASSAVYNVLERCGVVAGGWPKPEQIGRMVPSFCTNPCKETHFFTDTPYNPGLRYAENYQRGVAVPDNMARAFTGLFRADKASCALRENDSQRGACEAKRFLEGTPSTDYMHMPRLLASAMPPAMMMAARFVLILREPTERLLSWYNHNKCPYEAASGAPWDPCAKSEHGSSFDDYVRCSIGSNRLLGLGDAGNYVAFYDNLMSTGIARTQLLVLNYRDAFANASQVTASMRAISQHYGGPILDSVVDLPESNSKNYPEKLVAVKCSTRDTLSSYYDPMQTQLYQRLDGARKSADARQRPPGYEPPFSPFVMSTDCGDEEKPMGARAYES